MSLPHTQREEGGQQRSEDAAGQRAQTPKTRHIEAWSKSLRKGKEGMRSPDGKKRKGTRNESGKKNLSAPLISRRQREKWSTCDRSRKGETNLKLQYRKGGSPNRDRNTGSHRESVSISEGGETKSERRKEGNYKGRTKSGRRRPRRGKRLGPNVGSSKSSPENSGVETGDIPTKEKSRANCGKLSRGKTYDCL